ncbi:MAG: RluA family pseudouridine synthase [Candidatus Cloacimonetes bacterium]|nr:RluA family pseudouridine synthase [Candidatus Cloacimonadota bacterium]
MKYIYDSKTVLRIDKYLAELGIEELYSRSFINKLIDSGQITVNSQKIKKSYLLNENDVIDIKIPPPIEKQIKAEPIPLDIVMEDDFLAIINKPPGISVHPAPNQSSGTIVNAIINHFGQNMPYLDNPARPGIVHRLDKNTSGLLIVAKDDKTLSKLSRAFSERKIKKHYQAILIGIPKSFEGSIKTLINRNKKERIKMSVAQKGREAITNYRILKTFEFFSLADIMPVTGRTHQIRVHFDYINCPIAGDEVYGKNKKMSHLPIHLRKRVSSYFDKHLLRQALHAYRLTFIHPITKQVIDLEIDLPTDMKNMIDWLASQFETYIPNLDNTL